MAAESKRGCGYRKFGGMYIVCDPIGKSCDRLPFELSVCPCCGGGIKQARGYTRIQPTKILEGVHHPCQCDNLCPVCNPVYYFTMREGQTDTAGLLWVGEKYYTPAEFKAEVNEMGMSKRIPALPKGMEIGKTWIFLAHPKAIPNVVALDKPDEPKHKPGIFMAVKPQRIERIVKQTEWETWILIKNWIEKQKDPYSKECMEFAKDMHRAGWESYKKLQRDKDRGLTLVPLPDGDPDHQ